MKTFVKVLSIMLVLTMVLALNVGCSEKDVSDKEETQKSEPVKETTTKENKDGEKVEMRFAWWGGDSRHEATLEAINLYMKENPNVTINPEYGGWDGYFEKLVTQLAAGTAPDILQNHKIKIIDLYKGDYFVDLYNANEMDLSGFDKNFLKQEGEDPNGVLMGVPAGIQSSALIINRNFLSKFDISVDTRWTWEGFMEYGNKVQEKNSEAYLLAPGPDVLDKFFVVMYLKQVSGGNYINDAKELEFIAEDATKMYSYIKSLFDQGIMQPYGETSVFAGKADQNPKWINGEIGIVAETTATVSRYLVGDDADSMTFGPVPVMEGATETGVYVGSSSLFSVNKGSEFSTEGNKLVNWLVNDKEAAKKLGTQRSIPACSYAKDALVEANMIDKVLSDTIDQAVKLAGSPTSPYENEATILEKRKDITERLIFGELTPEEAGQELYDSMVELIAEIDK